MQDAIMKGNGNSRYLKSVASFLSLYPTYEDFAQALMAGTLPIDLNGINSAGWSQEGTPLNKASLLKDTTAALYGLGTDAVPDEVLAAIKPLIEAARTSADEKAKIAIGTYTGSAQGGKTHPNTLTFPFEPKVIIIRASNINTSSSLYVYGMIAIKPVNYVILDTPNPYSYTNLITWTENSVSWYSTFDTSGTKRNELQLNYENHLYYYLAIG